jgi:hypothetical protein
MNSKGEVDETDIYYAKYKEIEANHNKIEKLNHKLISEHEVNLQTSTKYIETINRLNNQLAQYDARLLERSNKKKSNQDSISSENNEDMLETDQHKLIKKSKEDEAAYVGSLKQVLEGLNSNLLNLNDKVEQEKPSEISGAICKSILVLINIRMELYLQSQFFRIEKETNFVKIKEASLNLWNLDKEMGKDFYFYYVDSNNNFHIIKQNEEETTIDNYLKSMFNVKKAVFLLLKKEDEYKIDSQVLNRFFKTDTKEQEVNKNIEGQVIEVVKGFYKSFVGLASHMSNKTKKILIRLNQESSKKNKNKDSENWKFVLFVNFFTFSLYLIFLLFTIFSIVKSNNPSRDLFIYKSINKLLNHNNHIIYNNMDSITSDLFYKLQPVFQSFSNSSDAFQGYYFMSLIRLSFFRVKNNTCPTFVNNVSWIFCIKDLFNTDNLELDENVVSTVDVWNDIYIDKDIEKFQIFDNNLKLITENKTKLELKSIFNKTMVTYFKDLTFTKASDQVLKNNYFRISGKLGEYTTNGYNIYLDVMNDVCFSYVLYLIQNSNLWNSGLRAVVSTFTLYNINFQKYVYIKILYEISSDGYVVENSLQIIPFEINVYFGAHGVSIYIYDIIRLICVIYFILLVFQIVLEVRPGIDGKINPMDYIVLLLQSKVILNMTISILFIIIFATKTSQLSNSSELLKPENRFNKVDYYSISSNFKNVFLYENILIFALVSRILLFFTDFKRIRTFSHLLHNVIKRLYFVFLNITFLYLGFVILANNLHGVYSDDYSDLPSSIRIILMISVGFPSQIYNKINDEFNFLFLYIIYMFIVYFLLNILIGAYIEMSRITGLIKGHVEDYKQLSMLEKDTLNRKSAESKQFLNKEGISIVS